MKPIRLLITAEGERTDFPDRIHAVTGMYGDLAVLCTGDMYLYGTSGAYSEGDDPNHIALPEGTQITCPDCIERFGTLARSFAWPTEVRLRRVARPKAPRKPKPPVPAKKVTGPEIYEDGGRIFVYYHGVDSPDDLPATDFQGIWDANRETLTAPGVRVTCTRTGDRVTFTLHPTTIEEGIHECY
jgi:hypothetical protein